jgi:hypothetical protein
MDKFGSSVAGIGDLNWDGTPDVAVGAEGDDTGGTMRGATHVLLMQGKYYVYLPLVLK